MIAKTPKVKVVQPSPSKPLEYRKSFPPCTQDLNLSHPHQVSTLLKHFNTEILFNLLILKTKFMDFLILVSLSTLMLKILKIIKFKLSMRLEEPSKKPLKSLGNLSTKYHNCHSVNSTSNQVESDKVSLKTT